MKKDLLRRQAAESKRGLERVEEEALPRAEAGSMEEAEATKPRVWTVFNRRASEWRFRIFTITMLHTQES